MSARARVVLSGAGVACAAGVGLPAFWRTCIEGRTALRRSARFETADLGGPLVGELPAFPDDAQDPAHADTDAGDLRAGRASAWAAHACADALEGAGLREPPRGTGLVLGTCLGSAESAFALLSGEPPAAAPSFFDGPARHLAALHALDGPVSTVSIACASGTSALGLAARRIRRGEADVMLAGGVDVLSRFVVAGFASLRALAAGEVRPFDRRRDGLALGEGAGFVVLEERERALRRGAPILAEVLGYGSAGDANHMTGPSPTGDGLVRAIEATLADARVSAGEVDFINAHGTGTVFNDRMETIAFERVFGERAKHIPIDSIKPVFGHTLGAAGALEAVLCALAIRDGIVPPTANWAERDPECGLDYVAGAARRVAVRRALSCSSAFAGNNAVLLLGAP